MSLKDYEKNLIGSIILVAVCALVTSHYFKCLFLQGQFKGHLALKGLVLTVWWYVGAGIVSGFVSLCGFYWRHQGSWSSAYLKS